METWLVALTGKSGRQRARAQRNGPKLRLAAQDSLSTADIELVKLKMVDAVDEYSAAFYTNQVCAVIAIRFCKRYEGTLTSLNAEERLLVHWHDGDLGCVSFRIVGCAPLAEPMFAVHQGGRALKGSAFLTTEPCCDRIMNSRMKDSEATVGQRVQFWRALWPQNTLPIGAPRTSLLMPAWLCHIICSHVWTHLVLHPSGRWDPECDIYALKVAYLGIAARVAAEPIVVDNDDVAASPALESGMFLSLADDIRTWVRTLAEHSVTEDVSTLCQFWVEWLEGLHHGTSPKAHEQHMWQSCRSGGGSMQPELAPGLGPAHRSIFRPAFMLQALVLCFDLRSSASLRRVVEQSVKLLSPSWSVALSTMLSSMRHVVPSAASLTRHRLFVDVAYMRWMRDLHQQLLATDTCFYNMLDSSPQGRYNYEIFQYVAIEGCKLVETMRLVEDIWGFKDDWEKLQEEDDLPILRELVESQAGVFEDIRAAFVSHCHPATSLGSSASSLGHTMHAVAHTNRLETHTWSDVRAKLLHSVSMTSDMGTEFGLTSIEKVKVQEFFPHWDCLAFEADELGADADHANEAAVELDFSHMLPVPGSFHIVDNMSKDVLRDLPHLPLVERQLHSVANYFPL
jgi:hypothetical protein